MCCDPNYSEDKTVGHCPDCGGYVDCDGDTTEQDSCSYSPTECSTCGYSPCDGSC